MEEAMTLERTEAPLHIPSPTSERASVQVDYLDVSRVEGDQPRYRLQPHTDGGKPFGPVLILEAEGAQALVQHLEKIMRDAISD
jgi:hypothetical protein